MTTVPSALGTEALERFIIQLFAISDNLDANEDGKVSGAEWGAAGFGLVMNFVTNKNLTAEVRDLDLQEGIGLVDVVIENFPHYAGMREEVRSVVLVSLNLVKNTVGGAVELFAALHALNKKPEAVAAKVEPTEPDAPFVDNSNNPKAPSKEKWLPEAEKKGKKEPAVLLENPDALQPELPAVTPETVGETAVQGDEDALQPELPPVTSEIGEDLVQ